MFAPVFPGPAVFPTQLVKNLGVVNCRSECVAFHNFTQICRCSGWRRLRSEELLRSL
jgi:hypothetical protein